MFIPAGWDNNKKIAILYENMHSVRPDQYYTDVIARPMSGLGRKPPAGRDVEVGMEELSTAYLGINTAPLALYTAPLPLYSVYCPTPTRARMTLILKSKRLRQSPGATQ